MDSEPGQRKTSRKASLVGDGACAQQKASGWWMDALSLLTSRGCLEPGPVGGGRSVGARRVRLKNKLELCWSWRLWRRGGGQWAGAGRESDDALTRAGQFWGLLVPTQVLGIRR